MTHPVLKKSAKLHISYILLISFNIISISIIACVPPVSRDALIHHLAIPKLYLRHGGMYEIPEFGFSYYPMNLDLLYLVALYFQNDILPKFIHFAFALVTAGMICRYLHQRINREYALLGALFFLSIPVIVRLSGIVYVDLGLICFLFASLVYIFQWIESGFRFRYLVVSAVFCGLALGTKYNALIGLFLLGLFVPFVYSRYRAGQRWSGLKSAIHGAVFVIVALLVFSPWMVRNAMWTGNPVYPLYNSVFNASDNSSEPSFTDESDPRPGMSHIDFRRHFYGESFLEIALIPIRVFFQGKDNGPQYFDGKLNPFLLLLPVFAFLGFKNKTTQVKTEIILMLFFSLFFLLFACVQTSIRIRYFSPIIPPLVVLSMFGLHHLRHSLPGLRADISKRIKRIVIFSIVFVMLGLNGIYLVNRFHYVKPIEYLFGNISRDQYIQYHRPEYASFQYANKHLSQEEKIFGLYIGNRGYYSDIPIDFDIKLLQQIAAKADSGKQVADTLSKKGFTHLLVNFSLFNHWVHKYSLHEKKMLKDFFDIHTQKKFSKDGYGLLRITFDPLT